MTAPRPEPATAPADREIELKFACRPQDLDAVLAAAPPGADETRELIAVYFDTPDHRLRKAGASLRVREHKGRRVQTLKRGEGLVREEHEAPIESLAPDPALGPLPSLLPAGATLRPVFNVRVSRRQRTLRYRGAEIELALDEGEIASGERKAPICEVELELKAGPPSALFHLARHLSAAAPLYLAFESKAARGHALASGATLGGGHRNQPAALSGEATVAQAFEAIAGHALAQIAANAASLRAAPGAEAVHQLRVGARRLRSALSTFGQALQDDGLAAAKADLRWLAQACDQSRNLDVFAEEALQPAEAGDAPPSGLGVLRKAIDAARRRAWRAAAKTVASEKFRTLMIDVTAWVETGAWRDGELARSAVADFAGPALSRRRKRLARQGEAAGGADDAARHHLRIEAKKLRYAAEDLADLYGHKSVRRYLDDLKALQDVLGRLNDLATAEPLVASLGLPAEAAFAAGELVGLKAAAKPRLVRQASKAAARLIAADPFWVR